MFSTGSPTCSRIFPLPGFRCGRRTPYPDGRVLRIFPPSGHGSADVPQFRRGRVPAKSPGRSSGTSGRDFRPGLRAGTSGSFRSCPEKDGNGAMPNSCSFRLFAQPEGLPVSAERPKPRSETGRSRQRRKRLSSVPGQSPKDSGAEGPHKSPQHETRRTGDGNFRISRSAPHRRNRGAGRTRAHPAPKTDEVPDIQHNIAQLNIGFLICC